jgi:hypothetical protein
MIRQSMDETELDRDSIFNQLRMKMSKVEMDNALDFLLPASHHLGEILFNNLYSFVLYMMTFLFLNLMEQVCGYETEI